MKKSNGKIRIYVQINTLGSTIGSIIFFKNRILYEIAKITPRLNSPYRLESIHTFYININDYHSVQKFLNSKYSNHTSMPIILRNEIFKIITENVLIKNPNLTKSFNGIHIRIRKT